MKKDRKNEEKRKLFLDKCTALRKKLVREAFPSEFKKKLTSGKLFSEILPDWVAQENTTRSNEKKLFWSDTFKRFSTYFTAFHENRENMYSDEDKSTAIAYRLINENLPRFFDNIENFGKIQKALKEWTNVFTDKEKQLLNEKAIISIFALENYLNCITQDGITNYNNLISGYATENKEKVRGLNEFINIYNQKNNDKKEKLRSFKLLYKQILSDRETISFIPYKFDSINNLYDAINSYYLFNIVNSKDDEGKFCNIFEAIERHFQKIKQGKYNKKQIYISNRSVSSISQKIFGRYSFIKEALQYYYCTYVRPKYEEEIRKSKISKREKIEKDLENYVNQPYLSIELADTACKKYSEILDNNFKHFGNLTITNYCAHLLTKTISSKIYSAGKYEDERYSCIKGELNTPHEENYRPSTEMVNNIKLFMDSILESVHGFQDFIIRREDENICEKDDLFYEFIDKLWEKLSAFTKLYDKTRNYLTGKTYSTDKIRLTFNIPALADGWDENKEKNCRAFIFKKSEQYYLGIAAKTGLHFIYEDNEDSHYSYYYKMIYKYFPPSFTMIPKCTVKRDDVKNHFESNDADYKLFESKKFVKPIIISKDIYDIYFNKGPKPAFTEEFIKNGGDQIEYKNALIMWIDFCKQFLSAYASTAIYNFDSLRPSSNYKNINEFYSEVSALTYKIKFKPISSKYIDDLVQKGDLYLFRITTKDFNSTHGMPNLHTLYWRALFSEQNFAKTYIKLDGEANIFYRVSSITSPIVHKKGSILVGRTTTSGKNIPEHIYTELCLIKNGKKAEKDADAETRKYLTKIKIREAQYDIIKDRRFTQNTFLFYVPLTFNFGKKTIKPFELNNKINDFLKKHDDVNIIGIDRGERHLLYVSVINRQGDILEQTTLNTLNGVDYHSKLDNREKERAGARKSWGTIGRIADLKEGYLSIVIHTLVDMMIRYNAIIVMEDLNMGFKRGRFKFEKQVYQKFEKALITKLNYLCLKNIAIDEIGGILHGWQLTNTFKSFKKIGHQNGIIFYIPAWNTSKIDPITGFVNVIKPKYTNRESANKFFKDFKEISYKSEDDAFDFVYTDKISGKNWIITTGGKVRYFWAKDSSGHGGSTQKVDITQKLKTCFNKNEIHWENGENLVTTLTKSVNASFLKEVIWCLQRVLAMRNSSAEDGVDFILSPVRMPDGRTFCSNNAGEKLPCDADANGAYNIARKGILVLERIKAGDKKPTSIKNEDWLNYAQSEAVVAMQMKKYK